jgi:hypothetical protein
MFNILGMGDYGIGCRQDPNNKNAWKMVSQQTRGAQASTSWSI